MADDAAYGCAAQCAQCAATQYSATDGASAGTNGCASFLLRHASTAAQAQQQGCE